MAIASVSTKRTRRATLKGKSPGSLRVGSSERMAGEGRGSCQDCGVVDEDATLDRLAAALRRARCAVALTGAGVSTASGLPDFRSPGGLWAGADPMREASLDVVRRDPDRLWRFYRRRLAL